jgi:uncharacterized membrane protein YGL010W
MRAWFIEQMACYASYHTDRRNEATHHVGVPLITFSILFALAYAALPFGLTAAWLFFGAVALIYVASAPLVGGAAALVYGLLCWAAHLAAAQVGGWTAAGAFAAMFVGGWAIQFWGHAFEGRKPALIQNLTQALMAPPFLVSGVLFRLGLAGPLQAKILERRPAYFAEGDPRRDAAAAAAE